MFSVWFALVHFCGKNAFKFSVKESRPQQMETSAVFSTIECKMAALQLWSSDKSLKNPNTLWPYVLVHHIRTGRVGGGGCFFFHPSSLLSLFASKVLAGTPTDSRGTAEMRHLRRGERAITACRSPWCQLPLSPICFGHAVKRGISDLFSDSSVTAELLLTSTSRLLSPWGGEDRDGITGKYKLGRSKTLVLFKVCP